MHHCEQHKYNRFIKVWLIKVSGQGDDVALTQPFNLVAFSQLFQFGVLHRSLHSRLYDVLKAPPPHQLVHQRVITDIFSCFQDENSGKEGESTHNYEDLEEKKWRWVATALVKHPSKVATQDNDALSLQLWEPFVSTFQYKKKTVTILVPQTKTTQPAEKLSLSWFFPLSHWKLPNMFGSCLFFYYYFLCSNRSSHQQNNKESSTALFQIQLVSHSNSLPIIRQRGGGTVLVADVTMREGRKRMAVVKRERERERRKALIPRRLWKWLRCDFRLKMRIMLLLDNKSSMIWFIFSKNLYQYLID